MANMDHVRRTMAGSFVAVALFSFGTVPVVAQESIAAEISIKNRQFEPSEIQVAAGKQIALTVKNLDVTPAEFESVALRVEKVIAGHSQAIIRLRPTQPGRYNFVDDFHQSTKGVLIVQ